MILIAKKPCSFGGKQFFIGDTIPADLVIDPYAQEKMGVLTIGKEEQIGLISAQEGQVLFEIPVLNSEGIQLISATQESIYDALRLMQMPVDAAVPEIKGIDSETTLIIMEACDQRKAVKTAAKKRTEDLAGMMYPEE